MPVEIRRAVTQQDRERVYRFRYDVHVRELDKGGPGIDHERQMIRDPGDDRAIIMMAEDSEDGLVGTARSIVGAGRPIPAPLRAQMRTGPIERAVGTDKISVTGRLMVRPSHRGRTIMSLLVTRLYEELIASGCTVDFCICALPLLRLYQKLGYRQYRDGLRPDGLHFRVPLVMTLTDRDHLSSVRSPLKSSLPESLDDHGRTVRALRSAYPDFEETPPLRPRALRMLWAELADGVTRSEKARPRLLDGFTDEEAAMVFARAVVHRFMDGELLQLGDERRAGLSVILEGRVGVGVPLPEGHHWLELFGPGEVFGEPEAPPVGRAADLVAIENVEVALLPEDIVERLEHRNPSVAMRLAKNLVAVLRQRIDDMHRLSAATVAYHRHSTEVSALGLDAA